MDTYSSSRDGGRHGSSRDHYSSRDDRRDRDRRRRSRSPGHRSSRREGYEVDTYSSSRNYREREREDRYRRDDRGWDRDRGSRRDRRGDDGDERPARRERDLFDDRSGRRGRGDRDGFSSRKKSATPPPKKKEPTPDLTDIVSVLDRKRRLTQWDIKPPGYENVTAEQAKLSGMFPLPGAPRQQAMDPTRLQALVNQAGGSANASALKASNSRQAKRLFVYNIPHDTTDQAIVDFFNLQMNDVNIVQGNDPCLAAHASQDREYAMVEFKTSEDATLALAFDGIVMTAPETLDTTNGNGNGAHALGLHIQRPKDYIVPAATNEDVETQDGGVSDNVKDTANKISITNIPPSLTDDQVTELLKAFGDLKAFVLVKDRGTDQSRGIAFCEYVDPEATDVCVGGLDNMDLGGVFLKVQRASIGVKQAPGVEQGVNAMSLLAGTTSSDVNQGRVIQLLNMVTPEELMDRDEYEEIVEDVREECEKYGRVLDLKIPRPSGARANPGVGKIYIKYEAPESAQKALGALAGRKFSDRTVVASFFGEEYFDLDAW